MAAVVGVACAILLAVASAGASNFSGATNGKGCTALNMADNGLHVFFYDQSVTGYMKDVVGSVRGTSYDPTDVTTLTTMLVTPFTDVVTYQTDYSTYCGYSWNGGGGSVVGLATCVSLTGSRCQKHEMRFDTSYVGSGTSVPRRNLACHETGHTLGLTHRSSGATCLLSGTSSNETIDSHDRNHLDAAY